MMTAALIIWIVIFIVAVNYCCLIAFFSIGLRKLSKQKPDDPLAGTLNHSSSISIIIAARNEEQHILKCLESIALQDYPKDLFELIIVNDQSEDTTGKIIDQFIESSPIDAKQLYTSGKGGKKEALRIGILASCGDKIITTDADCDVPPCWISEMDQCFQSTGAVFITGPVMMRPTYGFFNKFQCLEFNSLIASTAGSIGQSMPVMSNAANMGFSRDAYNEISTTKNYRPPQQPILAKKNSHSTEDSTHQKYTNRTKEDQAMDIMSQSIASGDDVFLMLAMKHHFGKSKIAFVNTPAAIVYTSTQLTLLDFIRQRLRWVSKSSGYRDWQVIFTAVSIFSLNLTLLLTTIVVILQVISILPDLSVPKYFLPAITGTLYLLKTLVDTLLLSPYLKKFGQYKLLWYLPVMELIVVLYTVVIGIAGNITSFSWKGRVINRNKSKL